MTNETTVEEELITRYRNWLTMNSWASGYWSNRATWEAEINKKIEELKLKLTK